MNEYIITYVYCYFSKLYNILGNYKKFETFLLPKENFKITGVLHESC